MKLLRISIDCILIIAAFITPWWFVFIVGAILLFVFKTYYEFIVLGFIIDTLYNAPIAHFSNVQFIVTMSAIILVFISSSIKARLRFYNEHS
jgi:hypothetical protein